MMKLATSLRAMASALTFQASRMRGPQIQKVDLRILQAPECDIVEHLSDASNELIEMEMLNRTDEKTLGYTSRGHSEGSAIQFVRKCKPQMDVLPSFETIE